MLEIEGSMVVVTRAYGYPYLICKYGQQNNVLCIYCQCLVYDHVVGQSFFLIHKLDKMLVKVG